MLTAQDKGSPPDTGLSGVNSAFTPGSITGTSGDTGNSGFTFNSEIPRAETSARLAAWNPQEGFGLIAVRYTFPEGYHQVDDADFFTLKPETSPGIVFGSTLKAEPVFSGGLPEYFDETTILLEFRTSTDIQPVRIRLNALFQICSEDGSCLFPDSQQLSIDFDPTAPALPADAETEEILRWNSGTEPDAGISSAESAGTNAPAASPGTGAAPAASPGTSVLIFLLMAFIGGILLNVMPCVLPLLSVKALGLVKQAGQDRKAILRHSWLYVAGIEVSFWVLALIVILIQASGRLLGWGFQFQSPLFVLLLIAVIWVFALSMFDVFVIEAPGSSLNGASAAGSRGGYLGSFLTGIFAVLIATPCTAPLLGPALGFAFSQPPLIILGIFSLTGLGLGLPFLLLGIRPGIIKKLPKPGNWMNTFKEVMGFLLFGTAVYLFTTFAKLAPSALNGALWWMLFLGFSAWLLGRARNPLAKLWFRRVGQIAALIIAVGSGFLSVDLSRPEAAEISNTGSENHIVFDEADILSRIAADEPIFLEFSAAWCTTCKVNQRVIKDSSIQALMKEKGVAHIKGDLTAYDETLTRWLADFGRAGVPLYVIYNPGHEPEILPELLSVEGFRKELEKINPVITKE
jgi:thiol:disulfide interchange protein DsbD